LSHYLIPLLAAIAASFVGLFGAKYRITSFFVFLATGIVFWLGLAGSQWTITQFPDFSDFGHFFPNQVWQRILWPIGFVVLWSVLLEAFPNALRVDTRLLFYAIVFGIAIYATLPFSPIWDDLIPENTRWLLTSFVSAICNYHSVALMCDDDRSTSGRRWAIWIIVANYGAITSVMFSQIGSLGEWCLALMSMAAVVAAAVSITGKVSWTKPLLPAMCVLAACLVANIRFNATYPKPWWVFGVLYAMPTAIAAIDLFLENRIGKPQRLVVSAGLGIVASILLIQAVWIFASTNEEW